MKDTLVIIPTYNERENIQNMIDAVMALPKEFDLLIVDDNSPDGTAAIVQENIDNGNTRLSLISRTGKLGLGTAYLTGFKWGLEKGYQRITEMDCDFSHNPNDLPRLRQAILDGADVAIGSRYVKGGGVSDWSKNRIFLSKMASLYARMLTGMPVYDTTSGFVCYTNDFLSHLDMSKIVLKGYGFQIQMKYAAYLMGYKIVEVPIIFKDRVLGTSKLSKEIIREAIIGVAKLALNSNKDTYRLKS